MYIFKCFYNQWESILIHRQWFNCLFASMTDNIYQSYSALSLQHSVLLITSSPLNENLSFIILNQIYIITYLKFCSEIYSSKTNNERRVRFKTCSMQQLLYLLPWSKKVPYRYNFLFYSTIWLLFFCVLMNKYPQSKTI